MVLVIEKTIQVSDTRLQRERKVIITQKYSLKEWTSFLFHTSSTITPLFTLGNSPEVKNTMLYQLLCIVYMQKCKQVTYVGKYKLSVKWVKVLLANWLNQTHEAINKWESGKATPANIWRRENLGVMTRDRCFKRDNLNIKGLSWSSWDNW